MTQRKIAVGADYYFIAARRVATDAYFHCPAHRERENAVRECLKALGHKNSRFSTTAKRDAVAEKVRDRLPGVELELATGCMIGL